MGPCVNETKYCRLKMNYGNMLMTDIYGGKGNDANEPVGN
jgi:hypothetical protein